MEWLIANKEWLFSGAGVVLLGLLTKFVFATFRTKNLSVNNIDRQRHLAEGDDRCCEMIQGHEATVKLLVAHQELAELIEPAVADLHNPAARLLCGVSALGRCLLAPTHDMRDVAMPLDDSPEFGASIAGIGAQVLAAALGGHRALDRDGFEHLLKPLAIIDVGRGHDDRQRDPTPVREQVTLAPIFFPYPSGWVPRILLPSVL